MMRRIELLPESYAQRRRERRTVGLIIAGAIVVLLLLVVWWVFLGFDIDDAEEELATAQQRNNELQAQIAELQVFADLEAEVDAKRAALSQVMAGDVDWPSVLTELAMVIPGDSWLTQFSASAGQTEGATQVGTETAPVDIAGEGGFARIQFTGKSLSMPGVARWLIRLGAVKEFEAIWLNDATEEEREGADIFGFDNTVELNNRAASMRFQGELQ